MSNQKDITVQQRVELENDARPKDHFKRIPKQFAFICFQWPYKLIYEYHLGSLFLYKNFFFLVQFFSIDSHLFKTFIQKSTSSKRVPLHLVNFLNQKSPNENNKRQSHLYAFLCWVYKIEYCKLQKESGRIERVWNLLRYQSKTTCVRTIEEDLWVLSHISSTRMTHLSN